jgi:hypothetical protein
MALETTLEFVDILILSLSEVEGELGGPIDET